MKIIIASDSYKGSCSTLEIANSIEKGFRRVYGNLEVIKIPMADGGEGTVDALVIGTNGVYKEVEVLGPLGEPVKAKYGIINNDIAVIEMAAASGITLINKDKLNPLITTTYGTGQLIKAAMEKGVRKILIGLGGSATNDGGAGMAQALGVSLKDVNGKEVSFGGGELENIVEIDIKNIHPLLKETEITVLSDVSNPLCGLNGASYVFGPQKGATKDMIDILDNNLSYFSDMIKKKLNMNVADIPGAGAAGGLGAGLLAFCNACIQSGVEKILEISQFERHLLNADLVITGEGKIDGQSKYGKVPIGVAKIAAQYNIPVVALVGSVGKDASEVYSYGIDLIFDIVNKPMSLEDAMNNAATLIEDASANIARVFKLYERMNGVKR